MPRTKKASTGNALSVSRLNQEKMIERLSHAQPVFVLDTNVIIGYPDIIPETEQKNKLDQATLDLSQGQIVIPSVVIQELSKFKSETSDRGIISRRALTKLRQITSEIFEYQDDQKPIFTILDIETKYRADLPFTPTDTNDNDGEIILTAILLQQKGYNVLLITNDHGMSIRAHAHGIKTNVFSYKHKPPYTGRRDIIVPQELLYSFFREKGIFEEEWKKIMPEEPPLIANEFIIMTPDEWHYGEPVDNGTFRHIGRYDAETGLILPLKFIQMYPLQIKNPGQAIYIESLMDPSISAVICTGPAGSGKTFLATVYGYLACKNQNFINVTLVPCNVDDDKLGALPGDLEEKLDPNVQPIKNAIRNFLIQERKYYRNFQNQEEIGVGKAEKPKNFNDKIREFLVEPAKTENKEDRSQPLKNRLQQDVEEIYHDYFNSIPIQHARGRDFSLELAIFDEFQDQSRMEADTLLKRIGRGGKIVITGDVEQIHRKYLEKDNNGLTYAREILKDSPMVSQVTFNEDEVVRHPLVMMITKRQKNHRH